MTVCDCLLILAVKLPNSQAAGHTWEGFLDWNPEFFEGEDPP